MTTVRRSVKANSVTEPFKDPRAPTESGPARSPDRAKTRRVSPPSSHRAIDARSNGTSARTCSLANSKTSSMLRLVLTAATMRLTVSNCSFASPKYSTSARRRSNSVSDVRSNSVSGVRFLLASDILRLASLLVSLDDSERRGEEVELLAQTVLQEALEGEVQAPFAARREDDEGGRAHGDLRDVLHVQARLAALHGRGRGRRATRRHDALEECVQLRGRDSTVARLVRAQRERQYSLGALPRERRGRDDRCPLKKLHLGAQAAFELRRGVRVFVRERVPLVDGDDDRAAGLDRVARDVRVQSRH